MLAIKPYNRERALMYARKYAFSQNPMFADFRGIGGNCTNFVSQCLFAAGCVMNYTAVYGWYYISLDDRSPSWAGVRYFYDFITKNRSVGPFGHEAEEAECESGDIIQLGKEEEGFYHTLLISDIRDGEIYVTAQTDDAVDRPLSTYNYDYKRFIRVDGIRFRTEDDDGCFREIYGAVPDAETPSSEAEKTPADG